MFHDMHPGQFENLVIEIAHELLGAGVQGFAPGPDGGRDGKFVGTARAFPSTVDPIKGITILQAKHITDPVAKFSDSDFSSETKSSIISEEIPRIKRLRDIGEIDNYLLFANRRLGAIADSEICYRISAETHVPRNNVFLIGLEQIERWIKRFPFLAKTIGDFDFDSPLRASPDDLANVITAIVNAQNDKSWPESDSVRSFNRVAFEKKNTINGLSPEYAKMILSKYLKDFGSIRKFLADPANSRIYNSYKDAVDEFSAKMTSYRSEFPNFDKLLENLLSLLIERDSDLKSNKRLTRTVYYFMYWACDIGTIEGEMELEHAASQ
jgi:hypothetical protein